MSQPPAIKAALIFPEGYSFQFRPHSSPSDEMVITVSSTTSPSFVGTNFSRPTLYIGDGSLSYYTRAADVVSVALARFLRTHDVRKVLMLGVSKGGFGALRLGTLAAFLTPGIAYRAVVFSPQTAVFPDVHGLAFPTYTRMVALAKADPERRRDLAAFGRLPRRWPDNFESTIYVGSGNELDIAQAALVRESAVIRTIPISGHLSHLPYCVDLENEAAIRALVDKAMAQGAAAGDPMAAAEREAFVGELIALGHHADWQHKPTIQMLAEAAFAEMSGYDHAGLVRALAG